MLNFRNDIADERNDLFKQANGIEKNVPGVEFTEIIENNNIKTTVVNIVARGINQSL